MDKSAWGHSPHFNVYTAVDPGDGINRPMPPLHPGAFDDADRREMIARIDVENAAVDWACRDGPLPRGADLELKSWACFVEAAPGMWIMFDDLPKELADALYRKHDIELSSRPIQRPFSAEELADLVEEIRQIEPDKAVVEWWYADFNDPYGFFNVPSIQVGRERFVIASGDRAVWFGDLPEETVEALYERHRNKLPPSLGITGEGDVVWLT